MASKAIAPKLIESLKFFHEKFSTAGTDSDVKQVAGLKLNDATFLRYLRARNGDSEKALHMLNNTIKWRQEFGLEHIHDDNWKTIVKKENETGKCYCRGFDKEGHVLLYMKPRYENTNDHDGNLKHLVYHLERAISALEHDNKDVEKLLLVIDYEGFSLLNAPPMKTTMATLHILQDHYPERLFRAYCVNPPWIFSTFWAAISPFIDPVTKQKIVMLNGKKDAWKVELFKQIDPSVLERAYGGLDSRPFNSSVYINGSFNSEYKLILDGIEVNDTKTTEDAVNSEVLLIIPSDK